MTTRELLQEDLDKSIAELVDLLKKTDFLHIHIDLIPLSKINSLCENIKTFKQAIDNYKSPS